MQFREFDVSKRLIKGCVFDDTDSYFTKFYSKKQALI